MQITDLQAKIDNMESELKLGSNEFEQRLLDKLN